MAIFIIYQGNLSIAPKRAPMVESSRVKARRQAELGGGFLWWKSWGDPFPA